MRASRLASRSLRGRPGVSLIAALGARRRAPRTPRSSAAAIWSRAGDCASCHTADGGKPFAGGRRCRRRSARSTRPTSRPTRTPASARWSKQDFYSAMHEGIGRDGKHLYPAFPYPWFTKVDAGRRARDQGLSRHACRPVQAGEQAARAAVAAQRARGDGGLERAVLPRGHVSSRIRTSRRNGIAAPTWSKVSAIAARATRRRTSLGATKTDDAARRRLRRALVRTEPDRRPARRPRRLVGGRRSSST